MAAQIIQFPVQHSNGYNNLIQLFEIDVYKRQMGTSNSENENIENVEDNRG